MEKLLLQVADRLIVSGSLTITTAGGQTTTFGDGNAPRLAIRFTSPTAQRHVFMHPQLHLGEAYVDGELVIEQGSLVELMELFLSQPHSDQLPLPAKMIDTARFAIRRLEQANLRGSSKRNVAHHYDLDGRLYDLFLDTDRQYSCAYFQRGDETLDEAQRAKKRHIAAKLLAKQGMRILDIGCGWGGMAEFLSETYRADVTGVTLSEEQLEYARGRIDNRPGGGRLDFQLTDYRDVTERYDRIVSVGMFEHVGINHYDTFFKKVRELLDDDGVMLLHSIGRWDRPAATNAWIAKYIFPGGYIPALSEVLPAIERAGLVVTDIEILRLHYAKTLERWRERFMAHKDEAAALFDERFVRLWEFYLVVSEMAFRYQHTMVFQLQLARRQDAVPLTRDYIWVEEARLRDLAQDRMPITDTNPERKPGRILH